VNYADGEGIFILPDGAVYLGAFSAGWPHGPGRLIGRDGRQTTGTWEEGALQGTAPGVQ
jgi:hypothetical protein